MQRVFAIEAVLVRDRGVVLAGILLVAALAWAYTVYLAQDMDNIGTAMSTPMTESWGAVDFGLMLLMWVVMMVAMMVPTAAPMVLVFAKVSRKRREEQRPCVPTSVFLLGYVLVWGGFAAAATMAQWGLHTASLLSSMMGESTNPILGGSLLLAAGIFQWSSLKTVCLTHCRSPLGFLMSEWREGPRGALTMGLRHGVFCVGCCWVLMGLLFVLGVMNLVWIAALAGFVLLEKVVPGGQKVSRLTGLLLVIWAGLMLAGVVS